MSELIFGMRSWLHRYTSTACRHHPWVGEHRCRVTCKFCGAMCRCWCHTPGFGHPVKYLRYGWRVWFNETFGRTNGDDPYA